MRCLLAFALLAVVLVGTPVARADDAGRVADVRLLANHLRNDHPDLFHDLSPGTFDAAVSDLAARAETLGDDEFLVGLMRLAALPGVREGHTGIFPLDPTNSRVLHEFPVRLYDFSAGTHGIGQAGGTDLLPDHGRAE